MTEPVFTRNYSDTATFETPLGTVRIIDSRNALDDRKDTWVYAEFAEARFNYDPADRNDHSGRFTINGREYRERVDISRRKDGTISVSSGRYGKTLTDAARKRLETILAPLVEPLKPRLSEDDYWEAVEGLVRGRIRSTLHSAVAEAESELRRNYLTYYSARESNGVNTDKDIERAHDMAVRVVNEEVKKLSTVRTLNVGFEKRQ